MNSIKIYTCHHKPSAFLNASIIKPLHVGKANTYNDIGCEGDDSGDNISFKNPFYCELTAHYWVWKNESLADYVGFMHYRRHLNFAEQQNHPEDKPQHHISDGAHRNRASRQKDPARSQR